MDELEISGRRYISTRRAGKENKYHADYIGQLIRAQKVAGQKVGRAWYVDAESLTAYLNSESGSEEIEVESIPSVVAPVAVVHKKIIQKKETQPVIEDREEEISEEEKETPVEDLETYRIPIAKIKEQKKHVPLQYIEDDAPFLPPLQKNSYFISVMPRMEQRHEVERSPAIQNQPTKRLRTRRPLAYLGRLAVLGGGVFALVLGASYVLQYTDTIQGGQQVANVSLGHFSQ